RRGWGKRNGGTTPRNVGKTPTRPWPGQPGSLAIAALGRPNRVFQRWLPLNSSHGGGRAFLFPIGAPLPAAPPCILHPAFPRTAGDRHAFPVRVRAPQRENPGQTVISGGPSLRFPR